MCQESFNGVLRKFPRYFKEVSRMFQFKKDSKAFQESFKVFSRKIEGISREFSVGFKVI